MTTDKPFIDCGALEWNEECKRQHIQAIDECLIRLLEQVDNAGLIKRLLGFYQTPCTILDGVQYSWPIPLDRPLHNRSNPIKGSTSILVGHPLHSGISLTQTDGGGASREESE